MDNPAKPSVVVIGHNDTTIWRMSVAERVRRLASAAGLITLDAPPERGAVLLADAAFVFDPTWFRFMIANPDTVLTLGGRAVLAHVADAGGGQLADIAAAMRAGQPVPRLAGLRLLAVEDGLDVHNHELRKREPPFVMPLTASTRHAAERASYYGAYKGVTDLLTKYLWPELAFHLTRLAARLGMTPNLVTAIGAAGCVAATFAFADGRYWLGMLLGFIFMVLDTVDGKLARCTVTSSHWGNVFDHGIDLVHPPFWWWAWGLGLAKVGLALPSETFAVALAAIIGGYVVQRLIEGVFLRAYKMHIHVWRPVDSWFRLITARRNPNMVILFISLLLGRPDIGLLAVAWWTVASLLFHAVRLLQAILVRASGKPILSWLGG